MNSSKSEKLVRYLREGGYPTGSSKQDKYVLGRSAKKITFDERCNRLFYVDEGQGGLPFKCMIIKEEKKLRNFQKCHSSKFPGHAGRDNKRQKEYKPNH